MAVQLPSGTVGIPSLWHPCCTLQHETIQYHLASSLWYHTSYPVVPYCVVASHMVLYHRAVYFTEQWSPVSSSCFASFCLVLCLLFRIALYFIMSSLSSRLVSSFIISYHITPFKLSDVLSALDRTSQDFSSLCLDCLTHRELADDEPGSVSSDMNDGNKTFIWIYDQPYHLRRIQHYTRSTCPPGTALTTPTYALRGVLSQK